MRNSKLKQQINTSEIKPKFAEAVKVPVPNTTNLQGAAAYGIDPFLKLLSLLNTCKLEPTFYKSPSEQVVMLKSLIDECGKKDPLFTAQCIVYSRCLGEGMRSVNQAASIFIGPYVSGKPWGKDFYSLWNSKTGVGGCIYRPDDMLHIMDAFITLNNTLSAAIKKAFKANLENLPANSILKYKNRLVDVIRMVRPNPEVCKTVHINLPERELRGEISVIDAVMRDYPVSADTHEVANSEAGQIVAKAVKEGILDQTEAKEMLKEAKAENWKQLITEDKLPIKASLMNIRNILLADPNISTVNMLCNILSSSKKILAGKIMPYEIDIANEIVLKEFNTPGSRNISQALLAGYNASVPNLKEVFTGNNCIFLDVSGSMWRRMINLEGVSGSRTSCQSKANLICATIALATNADIIVFGSDAKAFKYNPNSDVFTLAKELTMDMGATNLNRAWDLAARSGTKYDRIIILSDNECNRGSAYKGYTDFMKKVGSPYVYSIDLQSYGTTQTVGDKVRFYYGYGFSMFNDIKNVEWNPTSHFDKVRQIKFK